MGTVVYLGRSLSSVYDRVMMTHLATAATGHSTLRRSLGALLFSDLGLRAKPRGTAPWSAADFTNFEFEDDRALTDWMYRHLTVAGRKVAKASVAREEKDALARQMPLLNLSGWRNPNAKDIRRVRAQCVAAARSFSTVASCGAHTSDVE